MTPPPVRGRPLPKRTQLVVVLTLALMVGFAIAFGWLRGHLLSQAAKADASTAVTPVTPRGSLQPTPAQLASLKISDVTTMTFRNEQKTDGKIALDGDRTTPVFSPYSGRVTRVMARLGDDVRQGAPLLAIEASEFAQGHNDLLETTAGLNTARSQLNLAQITERRKHDLYDAKAGSLQDWLQSQADLVAAQSALRAAETAVGLARNRLRILGKSDAEISGLENAPRMDPVAYVVAPIGGTVIDRQVGLGQFVQANATTPLFLIGDLSTVWLVANVREEDTPHIRRGAQVEVRVLAIPDHSYKARITYVAPAIDANTRRLPVRAEIENREGILKPEMFATFSIAMGGDTTAPAVPEAAIIHEGDTARVWVVDGGTLVSRPIVTGHYADGMVEIVSGLASGEKVVMSGSLFIDRAAKGD
jgi:membrane fusion protein, heavy metal efflux system